MKKTFLFVLLIFFAGHLLMAQPACYKDVEYTLAIQKEVVKARKMMEEQCFPGNEASPEMWLLRGNVLIQLHEYELERKNKDPKYNIRWPDAIITANESFYKAKEMKPGIKGTNALLGPDDGQLLSATPIHNLALKAMENKDYNEAIRLLNMAIRSYRVDPKEYANFLGYAFVDVSNCYKAIGDEENYKKILLDAVKMNMIEPAIYLNLYNLYEQEKDTVKCGEILNQARKIMPDDLEIKGYELGYYAMIGDTVKLRIAAKSIFEQTKDNVEGINFVVEHLVDNKEYALAEEMIEAGLAIAPNNFGLNQQMTYRYFYEADDYEKLRDALYNAKPARKIAESKVAEQKRDELWEAGAIWAEKTYNIDNSDIKLNKMYNYMLLRLNKEVPEALQEKINSYNKPQNNE